MLFRMCYHVQLNVQQLRCIYAACYVGFVVFCWCCIFHVCVFSGMLLQHSGAGCPGVFSVFSVFSVPVSHSVSGPVSQSVSHSGILLPFPTGLLALDARCPLSPALSLLRPWPGYTHFPGPLASMVGYQSASLNITWETNQQNLTNQK